MSELRILICGGRDFNNFERVENDVLNITQREANSTKGCTFITGMARGADSLALKLYEKYACELEKYPADWNQYGKRAGFIRNQQMLDEGKPNVVIAYWDGSSRGTADMLKRVAKYNKARLFIKYYSTQLSIEQCRANPENIYLFGDNMLGKGKAGQACIRDEPNAIGIPTKRLPSMDTNAFFSDQPDEDTAVINALKLVKNLAKDCRVFVPESGLGTGLAKMAQHSPNLYSFMNKQLSSIL